MSNKHVLNRYENMEFPKHKFREYPKKITHPNGSRVLVKSPAEEEVLLRATDDEAVRIANQFAAENKKELDAIDNSNDRNSLVEKAHELGIAVDKRWRTDTLKELITKAETAQDLYQEAQTERDRML